MQFYTTKNYRRLTLVLFICLCRNSSDISLNSRLGLSFFIFVNFNDTRIICIYHSFISNILCHIYKEIIKAFCYHVLIIYDFDKSNHRPVSILPVISKFVKRAIHEQLTEYFNNHFHLFLSAFRSGYGCNSTLLKIIEDWILLMPSCLFSKCSTTLSLLSSACARVLSSA
jgi:hypothetical protein